MSSLRMAGVVQFNAFWKQAFATALAPACKNGAAALCSHTRAKTVLAFTRSFRWLISAFHRPVNLLRLALRALTLGARPALSTIPGWRNYEARPISYDDGVIAIRQEALIYAVANRAHF